jgi:hypothetical protein
MPRRLAGLTSVAASAAFLLVAGPAEPARVAQCGLPDTQPWWIEFSDGSVSFRNHVFARPGVIAATQGGPTVPQKLRAGGAQTVYWQMRLADLVGTTAAPKDAATIPAAADRVFKRAVEASLCQTPIIGLNELFGPGTTTPWTPSNAQYRANVLALLQALSSKGARPFLLLPSAPYTGGTAADWWRQAAQVADLLPEVYFIGPTIYRQGAVLASRTMRRALRQAIRNFARLGIPASRLGVVLGFQSQPGGRAGLQPAAAWYEVVKWEALAAKQVARELQIASIWSWGWGTFSSDRSGDAEKAVAACVYLWARDTSLCDAPAEAGESFDDSLTEGQIDALPAGVQCLYGNRPISTRAIDELERLTGNREVAYTVLMQRLVDQEEAPVSALDAAAAERTIVSAAYGGSLQAYLAALARARASRAVARGLLADEVRRVRIQATLAATPPKETEVQTFYASYATIRVRAVRVDGPSWWLGGRRSGYAVEGVAPVRVFSLATGVPARTWTSAGPVTVTPQAETIALGELPLALARPALGVALQWFAKADAFDAWTMRRQAAALRETVCVRDDLPEVAALDLSAFLPFLALSL